MESHSVSATDRATTGKGAARKSRKAGQTPGVVYRAGGSATPINFNVAELAAVFRKTANPNTIITLALDGAPRSCLIRDIQRNPVSRQVIHVDFYEVASDYLVVVDVAVNAVGRAVGTRSGGTLRLIARTLSVKCPAGSIPEKLEVDVTALDVGQFIRASEVVAPEGSTILVAQDFNVLTVEGKIKDAAVVVDPAAAAAAPAAGAKAPAAGAKAPAAGAKAPAAKAPAKDEKKK